MTNTWVDAVLQDILGRGVEWKKPDEGLTPTVEIRETAKEVVLLADMPGVDNQGVEVSLNGDALVLTGKPAAKPETPGRTYSERPAGIFRRRFTLDERSFDRAKITAVMKNGVLTVTLPKAQPAADEALKIEVKGE